MRRTTGKILTAAALIAAAALVASAAPVFALADDGGGLSIPSDSDYVASFTADGAADFAVSGAQYAFCGSDGTITLFDVDGKAEGVGDVSTLLHERGVSRVEYCEDAAKGTPGALYFEDSAGGTYLLSETGAEEASYAFTVYDESYTVGRVTYYIDKSGRFVITDMDDNTQTITEDDGYFGLKSVAGGIYVMRGGTLYGVEGKSLARVPLYREDDAAMNSISTADTAERIGETGAAVVSVADGALLVEVDPESFGDEFFTAYRLSASEGGAAQLLLLSGNAAVICYRGATCLTLRGNVTSQSYTPEAYVFTVYALTDAGVYSLPFACSATRVGTLGAGGEVTTVSYVSGTAFENDYIEIEYEGGTGYVLASLVSPYSFAGPGDDPAERDLAEASYDDVLYTVILVAVLVALVIVLVAYILIEASRRKRKGGGNASDA